MVGMLTPSKSDYFRDPYSETIRVFVTLGYIFRDFRHLVQSSKLHLFQKFLITLISNLGRYQGSN